MNLSNITSFFESLKKPYPGRDWLIVIVFTGALGIAGFVLAGYIFLGVQTGSIVSGSTNAPRAPIPVSREAIKNVLDTYQAKANNFASKTFAPVDLSDPRTKKK